MLVRTDRRASECSPVSKRRSPRGTRNAFALIAIAVLLLAGASQAGEGAQPAPLDLNRATASELEALPGIGAVKAAAILALRVERGGFQSLDELESVRGIGPALAARLKPLLTLGAGTGRKTAAKARSAGK